MKTPAKFPSEFEDLLVFADWALAREVERSEKRLSSNMAEMQRFYDAVLVRMDEILIHLNKFALDAMSEAEKNLLNLTYSLAEVSFAIEVYGQPKVAYSLQEYGGAERFVTVHGD